MKHSNPLWRASLRALTLTTICGLALLPDVQAGEIPASLRSLVMHPSVREIASVELAGTQFDSVAPFSSRPYLLWSAEADAPAPFAHEREAVALWLAECGEALGHGAFVAEYEETLHWRADEVWSYRLRRDGVPMRDGWVHVHWNGRSLVGLVNHLPGELLVIEAPTTPIVAADHIYYPVRRDGGVDLALARLEATDSGNRLTTRFVGSDGRLLGTEVAGTSIAAGSGREFEFTEYTLSTGDFPDQISADKHGRIWFSQPNDDLITAFRPAPESFQRHRLPSTAEGPDGLIVDRFDQVWTGLYYEGGLGRFDIATSEFVHYPAPYPNARMAIPVLTRGGHVWVTDHIENRVSEFDPETETWVSVHVVPTDNAWVVAGAEDSATGTIYFTEYTANSLGVKALGQPYDELSVPGSGPAFVAVSGTKVYYSQWNVARMGVLDIPSGTITEYAHPDASELGGPLGLMANGDIVIGTRSQGQILIFDTATESFSSYPIPTTPAGLKDGLTVDRTGVIWFTETFANKLAKLELF